MLDTNILDYIYDNDLSAYVDYFAQKGHVSLYVTNIQLDEIHEIPCKDIVKKLRQCEITKMAHDMHVLTIHTSIGVVGSDDSITDYKSSKRKPGFKGSRVGHSSKVADLEESQIEELKKLQGTKSGRNLIGKYTADNVILFTAMMEDMDYVATDDKKMENRIGVPKKIILPNFRLKIVNITKKDLIDFLNELY